MNEKHRDRMNRLMLVRDALGFPDVEAVKEHFIEKGLEDFMKQYRPGEIPVTYRPVSADTQREIEEIERHLRQPPPNIVIGAPLWNVRETEEGGEFLTRRPTDAEKIFEVPKEGFGRVVR